MTEWEQILKSSPSRAPFTLTMNADSTNEVWADIDTKLDKDEAWHIVGCHYTFEKIDPTTPLHTDAIITSARTLQIQRGADSEILLNAFDPLIIMHHSVMTVFGATEAFQVIDPHPYKISLNEVTRHNKLRALFRTSVDQTQLSLTTVQLSGVLLYHLIGAPDDGRTKLGIHIDEI